MLKNRRFIIKTRCKVTNFYFNICHFFAFFFNKTAKKRSFIDQTPILSTKKSIFQPHNVPKDVLQHKVPILPTDTLFIIILIHGSLNAGQAKSFNHFHRLCKARLQGCTLVGCESSQHIVDLRTARKIVTNAKA